MSYIKDTSLVVISANIIIFPIIAYIYKTISFTFIFTNILTNYLIGIIIITGFFLIIISFLFFNFAHFIGEAYKVLINMLIFITENTAKIPFSKKYIKAPYLWEIVFYYIFIFSFYYLYKKYHLNGLIQIAKKTIYKMKSNYRKIVAVLLIAVIFYIFAFIQPKNLQIYFIDVRPRRFMPYYYTTWQNHTNRSEED